jgi:hypothetical protein
MNLGAVIGYAVAFLFGLIVGRVWGGASARKDGSMLSQRPATTAYSPPTSSAAADSLTDGAFEEEVRRLAAVNLINAIKFYRRRTGCSLKDAKDAVERIRGR